MRQPFALVIGTVMLIAVACGSSSADKSSTPSSGAQASTPSGVIQPGAGYHPAIDPTNFRAVVDNAWFPLKPGTTYTYQGVKDQQPARDVYTVSHATKTIDGVPCVIVDDRLYLAGALEEKTSDYYTQDLQGNVWYFGEDTAELDKTGKVTSTEGSWKAGQDGAEPGIFMEAKPVVGHAYRQEYYRGHAEDRYRVMSKAATVNVPYGSFKSAMLTQERTRIEPGVLDHKYYVKGIGEVAEVSVKGPTETSRLVSYASS